MLEDKQKILQAIIDHTGDCGLFATTAICKRCPLGNKRVDGRRVNCMDYLNIDTSTMEHEEVCDIYEKAAEEELFSLTLEDHLSED